MMSDRAKHWHKNWMEHIGVSIIVHKCERSCRDKMYFTEYFTYWIYHDVWRDERSVPAATLGACSGIICLIGIWFQFECLCSKFLSHPKVLERFKQPTHMNTKENINSWFAYDNSLQSKTNPLETHVHFPPTSGQVEEERYFEFPERLEVLAEAFAWKLFEGILITLRRLLHLPLLLDKQRRSLIILPSQWYQMLIRKWS